MFAGATPWDSGNFNPATKADLNSSVAFGLIKANALGGTTGGQLMLAKPPSASSTLANDVVFDISQNSLRIYENASPFRGVAVDLTGAGSQSNLWHSGNFTPSNYAPITAPNINTSLAVITTGGGRVGLSAGSASNDGYVEFRNKDGVRSGYIGWSTGGNIGMTAENSNKFNFNVNPTVNGSAIWNAGNFDPATKLNATSPNVTGDVAVRSIANSSWGGISFVAADTGAGDWYFGPSGNNNGRNIAFVRGSTYVATFGADNSVGFAGTVTPANMAMPSGTFSFGSAVRQMINLWGTSFGIGVQSSTSYIRTATEFAVHAGGVHDNAQGSAGTGGTNLLRVASSYFNYLGNNVWHAGNFDPNTKANITGQIFSGDITTHRNNNTGVVFLGNAQNRYLFFDGSNYQMPGSDLYVNGALVARNGAIPRFGGVNFGTGQSYIYSDTNSHNVVIRGGDGSTNNPYRYIVIYPDVVRTINSSFYADGDIRTAGKLIAGEGATSSYVEMRDTDEGTRFVHNNSGTIGFLGSDGAWKLRVYDSGQIWSPAFGDITTYVGGRVAKTGDSMTGELIITKGDGQLRLADAGNNGQWRLNAYSDQRLYFQDWFQGQYRGNAMYVNRDGSVWTSQFGDLNTRIEDRAYAWAADRASLRLARSGDAMSTAALVFDNSNNSGGRVQFLYGGALRWGVKCVSNGELWFLNDDANALVLAFRANGTIYSQTYGELSTYIDGRVNNKNTRLAYAGDLDNNWNYGGGYEEPYAGAVVTSRQIVNTPAGIMWGGGRWRYVQTSTAAGLWYTVGYV